MTDHKDKNRKDRKHRKSRKDASITVSDKTLEDMKTKGSYISSRDVVMNENELNSVMGNKTRSRETLILDSIHKYYSKPGLFDKIRPYIEKSEAMSLRDFESFNVHVAPVMNAHFYRSRQYPCTNGDARDELFIIYHKYKAKLRSYNKQTFDPFARGGVIAFHYTKYNSNTGIFEQRTVNTTICQLNYFYWIQDTGILNYIIENIDVIAKTIKDLDAYHEAHGKEKFRNMIEGYQRQLQSYIHPNITLEMPTHEIHVSK